MNTRTSSCMCICICHIHWCCATFPSTIGHGVAGAGVDVGGGRGMITDDRHALKHTLAHTSMNTYTHTHTKTHACRKKEGEGHKHQHTFRSRIYLPSLPQARTLQNKLSNNFLLDKKWQQLLVSFYLIGHLRSSTPQVSRAWKQPIA